MLRRLRDRFHSPTSSPAKCGHGSSSSHTSGAGREGTSPTAASTGSFPNRDGMTLAAAAAAEAIAAASFTTTTTPTPPSSSPPPPPPRDEEEPKEEQEQQGGGAADHRPNPHRSVNDYVSADDLRRALRSSASDEDEDDADAGSSCSSCSSASAASSPPSPSTRPTEMAWFFARNERAVRRLLRAASKEDMIGRGNGGDGGGDGGCEATKQEATAAATAPDPDTDWVLQDYDAETTDPDKLSLEHELRRLLVLKSFLILDQQQQKQPQKEGGSATQGNETGFDDITELARTTFRCPISTIGMVDLGRQWFLSKRGLDAAPRSFPRKLTFCQHAIASTRPVLIVPDTALDARFCDNPVVTGPPRLRFYAGCSLVSPEGYRIGTLCIMDTKPRPPPGLDPCEQETLLNLASTTVTKLVQHRTKMSIWFNNLVTTHYPDLSREEEAAKSLLMAPDDSDGANEEEDEEDNKREEEEGEENENNQQQQQQQQQQDEDDSKICEDEDDKDFAAFLENTKQMPLEDLIRLLQKQAREQQAQRRREEGNGQRDEPSKHAEEGEGSGSAAQVQEEGGEGEEGVGEAEESKQQPPPTEEGGGDRIVLRKRTSSEEKRFRFAENARVYEIESHKGIKEQWWSADEMYEIRSERKQTAQYFRKYRQDYIQSLKYILKYACTEQQQQEGGDDDDDDHDNDEDTKRVVLNAFLRRLMTRQSEQARGLESHIVRQIRDHQKRLVVAVLDEQDEGKAACDDSDTMWNMIRDQSLTYSEQSTRFAFNLAQVDRIQALKEATAATATTTTAENKKQKQKDSTARQPCRQPSLKERLLNATSPRQPFRRPSFSEHADDPVA